MAKTRRDVAAIAIGTLLVATACRNREPSAPPAVKSDAIPVAEVVPASEKSLRSDPVELGFDLYFISQPAKSPTGALARLGGGAPTLHVRSDTPEWPLPPVNPSFYAGLSHAQAGKLALSKQPPLGVRFTLSQSNSMASLKEAERLIGRLARDTGGFIYDYSADRVFSADAFVQSRVDGWSGDIPDARRQVTVAGNRKGPLWRSATHGMEKFGLPDIVVADHSASSLGPMGNLLNLIAQSLVERRPLDGNGRLVVDIAAVRHSTVKRDYTASMPKGAPGRADVRLVRGSREEGDEHNRVLLVAFDNSPSGSVQEKHEQLLAAIFAVHDPAFPVEHGADYLAASRRAQAQLPKQREQFRRGLGPGERILVYAPFSHSNGREWMWVEVVEWPAGKVKGLLMSTPQASSLKAGALVEVSEDQIADYLHEYSDGRSEGHELKAVFEKRRAREAPQAPPAR